MTTHRIKCDPQPFKEVLEGTKKAELRYNDRGYRVGDTLVLMEIKYTTEAPDVLPTISLTGREINALITHILDVGSYCVNASDWVILSLHGAYLMQPEFKSQPGILICDDAEQEYTEEQKVKIKEWYDKTFPVKREKEA
jgi:hypothetical protein